MADTHNASAQNEDCSESDDERDPSQPQAQGQGACRDAGAAKSSKKSSFKISLEDKLESAKEYKKAGNEKYKCKLYKAAIGKYHRALLYVKGIDSEKQAGSLLPMGAGNGQSRSVPEHILQEATQLKIDCYNNLAACILLGDDPSYHKVVYYCDCILNIDTNNTKALYRRGVALYHLKDTEKAMETLLAAKRQPQADKDPNIRKYIMLCERDLVKQEEKMRKTYKNMFDRMAEQQTDQPETPAHVNS